jgi:ADP-dependent NAD(P)H-hydrate dehydratase
MRKKSMPNPSETQVITPSLLREWPLPVPGGGKDARGTVLVVGGSRFTPGAVLLAGVAALRAGAGVLQLAVVGLPETAAGSVEGTPPDRLRELAARARVVLVGPGLDDVDRTGELLRHLLDAAGPRTGIVLDAYALGALSRVPDLLAGRTQPVVLTPNRTEADYLLGNGGDAGGGGGKGDDRDPIADAAAIAERFGATVSLFGAVASPDGHTWRDGSGDAGLGTSGSGDVLAGLVAGLLSRGADPAQAACYGAHVHGVSGQRLIPRYGRIGYLARELLDEIPRTLATL